MEHEPEHQLAGTPVAEAIQLARTLPGNLAYTVADLLPEDEAKVYLEWVQAELDQPVDECPGVELDEASVAVLARIDADPEAWRNAVEFQRDDVTYEQRVAACDGFAGRPFHGTAGERDAYYQGLRDRQPQAVSMAATLVRPRAPRAGRPRARAQRRSSSRGGDSGDDGPLGEPPPEPEAGAAP